MDFAEHLQNLLGKRGLTQLAFAQRIGRSTGFISDVLNRKNGPSDDLESWADALELQGSAREEFLLAGSLARSPKRVRDHIANLEQRVSGEKHARSTTSPKAKGRKRRAT